MSDTERPEEFPQHGAGQRAGAPAIAPMSRPGPLAGSAITGFAMGVAEVVPGFSGGTVALVAGIYTRLIAAIRTLVGALALLARGRWSQARTRLAGADWFFLVALGVGMAIALLTVANLMSSLIESHPVQVQAVLFGLVLGAAVVAAGRFRNLNPGHVLAGVGAAAAAFVVLGLGEATNVEPALWQLFLGGAIAVCAWILPGVSGSFFLLVLGLYPAVLQAVSDRDVVAIAVIGAGCVVGLAAFSTVLSWALERAYDLILAVLIGFMVGSVRVLWPWPSADGVGSPQLGAPESDTLAVSIVLAASAFVLVAAFGFVQAKLEHRGADS